MLMASLGCYCKTRMLPECYSVPLFLFRKSIFNEFNLQITHHSLFTHVININSLVVSTFQRLYVIEKSVKFIFVIDA